MLPITPPPNGWAIRLAEHPGAGVRPADGPGGGALYRGVPRWKDASPGVPRESTGFGGPRHAPVVRGGRRRGGGRGCCRSWPLPAPAGAAGLVVKITPDQGLKAGQTVTVSGHGLPKSSGGSSQTWFVTECTAAVRGRMDPATDTPHCDITHARPSGSAPDGTFTLPLPPDDGHHRRRLLRHGRARHLRHRRRDRPGTGHGRARSPSRLRRRRRRPPRPDRPTTGPPLRRRAATPGGCSR